MPVQLYIRNLGATELEPVTDTNPVPVKSVGDELDASARVLKVEERFRYAHVAAGQGTTVLKNAPAFLHAITFNSKATASNVTTVYDDPKQAGEVVAVVDAPNVVAGSTAFYDVELTRGLTIGSITANGADMTVAYR